MMKKAILLSIVCLLVNAAHPNVAAALTGTDLYESCSDMNSESAKNLTCTAYVHGFIDGMIMGYTAHGTYRKYCPPKTGVSVTQGRLIIEKYLRDHPERLKTEAGILAGLAMSEAFPCRPASK